MRATFGVISLAMIMMLVSLLAVAQTPVDLLKPRSETVKTIDLSGIDPSSPKAMDVLNANLTVWKPIAIADLGQFFSDRVRIIKQGLKYEGVPDELINYTKGNGSIPQSFDSNAENNGSQSSVNTSDKEGLVFD
jgi:hypothetical protein